MSLSDTLYPLLRKIVNHLEMTEKTVGCTVKYQYKHKILKGKTCDLNYSGMKFLLLY